jgi:hypothetical protein
MSEAAATTTVEQPAAAAPAAAATTATQSAPDLSWLGDGAKPEVQQYVQGKGFKSAAALAEAYQNAEKALSSRSFEPPKPEDTAGWAKIKAAMGVPEAPDKYDLGEAGKALKPEALQQWAPVFHQLGLSNEQAAKLVAQTTEMATKAQAVQEEAYVKQTETVAERMKLEYGDKWPAFHDIASRGFNVIKQQLKLDDTKVDALERALGTRELLSLAHMIGEAKVEAGFVASDGQHRAMTKDQARQAIAGFKGNPEKYAALMKADHPNHAAALSEWTQLRRIAEA